ncbi:MAG TPA: WecB/TagA/CpsF family glycosyltransferase [Telmatospirillum sp.]|nr:WecB/TagA/CpsF family glycosyltransferase [Telmatospirillum sp.]
MRIFPSIDILGLSVHMASLDEAIRLAEQWIRSGGRHYVCHVTVHSLMMSRDDPMLLAALSSASLAGTDGMPLVWIGRRRGFACDRVYGPDFMQALCRRSAAWQDQACRHFLYGATPRVLELLSARLREIAPGIVIAGTLAPPMGAISDEDEAAHCALIDASGANVVWVGLGAPKQELWMARNRSRLRAELLVGVGAAFDFLAGVKPQAPQWMRRMGLEWAFRLISEPRRLGRRYLSTNSRFLVLLALSAFSRRVRTTP